MGSWHFLLGLSLLYIAGCNVDKSFIFFPDREITQTPADAGVSYEDVYLTTRDSVRINGWFVPHPVGKGTLLWFHGNGGNLSDRVPQIALFHSALPVHIFILDYREYGKSEGAVSEEGTYRDAEAAYDYLKARPDVGKIYVYGQSLGAAVAMETTLRRAVEGLILEAPFLSIREMAKVHYGWLPVGGLITTHYDNIGKVGKVSVPILILHGDRDETVPYDHGQRLFSLAHGPKQFYTIKNSGHNNTYKIGGTPYLTTLSQFLTGGEFSRLNSEN